MSTETPLAGYGTHLRATRDQLVDRVEQLEVELAKWKLGCETNADCYREAVRAQDSQRLEIIALKNQLAQRDAELAKWKLPMTTDTKPEELKALADWFDKFEDGGYAVVPIQDAVKNALDKLKSDLEKCEAGAAQMREFIIQFSRANPAWKPDADKILQSDCGQLLFPSIGGSMNQELEKALELTEKDPHQFSSRPCPTCHTMSVLIKRPFGCNAMKTL